MDSNKKSIDGVMTEINITGKKVLWTINGCINTNFLQVRATNSTEWHFFT